MKKILIAALSIFIAILLLNYDGNKIEYSDVNILSFEIGEMSITKHADSLQGKIKIKNNSNRDVAYCSINVAFYDAKGKEIHMDSRVNDIAIESGKTVELDTYCKNGINKIAKAEVVAYDYKLLKDDKYGNDRYEIDTETKEIVGYHEKENEEEKFNFDDVNLLSFEIGEITKPKSNEFIKSDVKITNKSNMTITQCDYSVVYYDKDDTAIYKDSRFNDVAIAPKKHIKSATYSEKETENISKIEVDAYTYTLSKLDNFGNISYKVNTKTKKVEVIE